MDNNNKKHPLGRVFLNNKVKKNMDNNNNKKANQNILTISILIVICMCPVGTVVSVSALEARVMVDHGFESRLGRLFFFCFFFLFFFCFFFCFLYNFIQL